METTMHHSWRKRRLLFLPIILAGLFGISAIVMVLWNSIIPGISGLLPLNYWQAMGLLVLCRILTGGCWRGHHGHKAPFMHRGFRNKFMEMNDQERQEFKNQWKERCSKWSNNETVWLIVRWVSADSMPKIRYWLPLKCLFFLDPLLVAVVFCE